MNRLTSENSAQRGDLDVFNLFLRGATVNGIPAGSRR